MTKLRAITAFVAVCLAIATYAHFKVSLQIVHDRCMQIPVRPILAVRVCFHIEADFDVLR
jgi:hypothetical protein